MNSKRLLTVKKNLYKDGIEQMLITDPNSVFYLLNQWIWPGERFMALLLRPNSIPVFFVNKLFCVKRDKQIKTVLFSDTEDIIPLLKMEIDKNKTLGIDKTMSAQYLLQIMKNNIASSYVNSSISVDAARAIKDESEIEKMRYSSLINDKAMGQFVKVIKDGIREIDVVDEIHKIYRSLGASRQYNPVVGFGINAADPHHIPDETVIKDGDTVLLDAGCVVDNYSCDMTRTFYFKRKPPKEVVDIYNTVKAANEETEKILKPRITFSSIDGYARNIISTAGYGDYFTHRLGHFIGLQDHDFGNVSSDNYNFTARGNTFSIEPGIYDKKIAGVRIEDVVLITSTSYEVLNHYSKEITVIG